MLHQRKQGIVVVIDGIDPSCRCRADIVVEIRFCCKIVGKSTVRRLIREENRFEPCFFKGFDNTFLPIDVFEMLGIGGG